MVSSLHTATLTFYSNNICNMHKIFICSVFPHFALKFCARGASVLSPDPDFEESLGINVWVPYWTLQRVFVCQSLRWGSLSTWVESVRNWGSREVGEGKCVGRFWSHRLLWGLSQIQHYSPRAVSLSWASGIAREKGATFTHFPKGRLQAKGGFLTLRNFR